MKNIRIIENPIKKISQEELEFLVDIIKNSENKTIKPRVVSALQAKCDIELYASDDWKVEQYLKQSLISFKHKYKLLQECSENIPVRKGDEITIRKLSTLRRRIMREKTVNMLVDVYAHKMKKREAMVKHGIAEQNISRACKSLDETIFRITELNC